MPTPTVSLAVFCPALDPEGLAELTAGLHEAVAAGDVDAVRRTAAGPAPAGAKAGELIAVGALVVAVAPPFVEGLMTIVSSWLSRQPADVEVEIDGQRFRGRVTRAQRDALIGAYLQRVGREP